MVRVMSAKLLALRRLHRRLSINHPKFVDVQQDLYNSKAGHGGEEYIDSVLSTIHFPIPHIILPNFRLQERNIPSTQIDILLITPAYALIIEVKNWAGIITFQDTGQVIQEKDGFVRSMDCPIVQAEYYQENLQDWFMNNAVPSTVHRVVIFPFASTILKNAENRGVHFAKELPSIIRRLNKLPVQLTNEQFNSLSLKLNASNRPFSDQSLCDKYGVLPSELSRGIYCLKCDGPLVKRTNRIYVCSHCLYIPDNPLYDVMMDWFTLVDSHITNKQLRLLSGVEVPYTVGYFMKKTNFPRSGKTKATVYHINNEEKNNFVLDRMKKG